MNFDITVKLSDGTSYVARPTLRDLVSAEDGTNAQTHPVTYTARIAYSWARRNGKTHAPFEQWTNSVVGFESDNTPGKPPASPNGHQGA